MMIKKHANRAGPNGVRIMAPAKGDTFFNSRRGKNLEKSVVKMSLVFFPKFKSETQINMIIVITRNKTKQ